MKRWVMGGIATLGMLGLTGPTGADAISDEASVVAYWQLDEAAGSSTVGDSVGSNTGTVVGGVTLGVDSAMPLLGTAAQFDGTGKIDSAYSADLNTSNFTLELWARVDGGSSHRSPFTSRESSPARGYIFYAKPSNDWSFWTGQGATNGWHDLTGVTVQNGQWIHLAGTVNGTTKNFYANGHLVATASATYEPNTRFGQRIGSGGTEGDGIYPFNGAVDNVAVFNQALEHQRIADHYNDASEYARLVKADNAIAHWRLGEQGHAGPPTAYNALDVTAHTGAYENGLTGRQFDSGLRDDVDTSVDFDGVDDRVRIDYDPALHHNSFSVELWAKPEGKAGDWRAAISARTDVQGDARGFILYAGFDDKWQFWTGTGGEVHWDTLAGSDVVLNEWAHIVATFDWNGIINADGALVGTKRLYVNGVEVGVKTNAVYEPMSADNNAALWLGAGTSGGSDFYFDGKLDEVALYGHVLSAQDVQSHYALAAIPEPATLLSGLVVAAAVVRRRRR